VNVGLFGGTFDPPHCGHLIVAQDAALALGLDRILFVPAAQPPHKLGLPTSPADVRARMLQQAIAGDDRFAMDTLELDRSGPSWTVDTLRELSRQQPDTRWTLLIGVDQYTEFANWRSPDEIRRLARIGVLTRSGLGGDGAAVEERSSGAPAARPLEGGDVQVAVTRIDISSTAVRQRVAAGHSIRYLVPTAVETFIFEAGLYRRNGVVAGG
jgi:nicotinate-nucleotide adenylyltransferase